MQHHYALYAIPVAHAAAINRLFNDIEGDVGDNFSVPLSADGQEPATYLMGGRPANTAWLAKYQNLDTAPHVPAGGWPIGGGVTEQQVSDAVAVLEMVVRSGPSAYTLPAAARGALLGELGVQEIIPDI